MKIVSRNGVQPQPVLAHRLHDDLVLDELDAGLGQVAHAGRRDHRVRGARRGGRSPMPISDAEHAISATLLKRREEVLPADDLVDRWEFEGEACCATSGVRLGRRGLSDGGLGLRPG